MPYIGSRISLVTNSDLRYEGTLININTAQSTVTLREVRMSGTDCKGQFVMPTSEVFDYIVFNGKDIKDLTVSEPGFSVHEDPAIVSVNVPPSQMHYGRNENKYYSNYGSPPNHRQGGYQQNYNPQSYNNHRIDDYTYRNKGAASRTVVGELNAQPNMNLKQQVADAFDFEQANVKFAKEVTVPATACVYNKESSFFDNISCESLARAKGDTGRIDRDRQNERDTETFGAAAISGGPRYTRRQFRRGGIRGGIRGSRPPQPTHYYGIGLHA